MRAVAIAAAGAALVGSTVAAGSHVENMHKRLHARSGWGDWSSEVAAESTPAPEYTKPADPVEGDEATETWSDWETTTSTPVEVTSTSYDPTWSDWESTTSTPVEVTSTSYDPTWSDWESTTTSTPVKVTSTSSYDPAWSDWETTSSPVKITSTTSAYDPTWSDWEETISTPAEITSTEYDPAWSDWVTATVVKSGTTTTTIYLGIPTDTTSWEDWATVTSSDPSDEATTTWEDWSSVPDATSTPAVWSSDGWFGPGWHAVAGECAVQVVTSYGSPIWAATPDATMPVISVTVTPTAESTTETWADWSATSSDPSEETTATTTWEDWSATSSDPAVVTSTDTTSWEDWTTTTSSVPSVDTTTSATWTEWSAVPTGGLGDSEGNTWGMTYSPYTAEGGCKDAATVEKDLTIIASKGFSTVRVYSTDCSTLENVGTSARNHGLKLILGVFISSTGIEASKEQVWDIIHWGQWDLVELIVIGNEAVFNGYCSASELAAYIAESAAFFKKAGYTGPVSTTEPLAEWEKDGAAFCSVIDVVAANLYAFFNPTVTPDMAGDFIQRQIKELESVCPGKETYVMESGWPHAGNCNGAACPSPENQATAIKSIQAVTGSKVIYFSYEDEAWKSAGEFGVEQYWGCASVF